MVVIFYHENEEYVSAAPKKWLCGNNSMMWPKNRVIERKAIKLNMKPEEDWIKYNNIQIIGYFATLKEALFVEKKKQNSSSSEAETTREKDKRKIITNKKYRDDSISPPPLFDIEENSMESPKQLFPSAEDIMGAAVVIEDDNQPSNVATIVQSSNNVNQDVISIQPSMSDVDDTSTQSSSTACVEGIMLELREINKFVTYTMRKVEAIELSLNRLNLSSHSKDSLLPNLPLTELAQLKSLEEKLTNEKIRTELFDMLRHTGGSKERDCVNRCLEKIFSNYLGQYCSWTGKKNNFKLSSLILMDILKLSARESFPNITDESFERHVMSWFQHASTRLKRLN